MKDPRLKSSENEKIDDFYIEKDESKPRFKIGNKN